MFDGWTFLRESLGLAGIMATIVMWAEVAQALVG